MAHLIMYTFSFINDSFKFLILRGIVFFQF